MGLAETSKRRVGLAQPSAGLYTEFCSPPHKVCRSRPQSIPYYFVEDTVEVKSGFSLLRGSALRNGVTDLDHTFSLASGTIENQDHGLVLRFRFLCSLSYCHYNLGGRREVASVIRPGPEQITGILTNGPL